MKPSVANNVYIVQTIWMPKTGQMTLLCARMVAKDVAVIDDGSGGGDISHVGGTLRR